ncbi:RDD family protein [Lentibacillus sediminis]|uniref:RDD family protein n=1 Tax=Lentibacillus sediminis TaxID=1940529 RepID=UPI000C1C45FF|nr:RDD family protein [Lentibacillus sediminis]
MNSITKKRLSGYLIDVAISTAVTAGVEYFLRKKVKNEAVHALVTPTVVLWGLEYVQLRQCRQTLGYKAMGITVENKEGGGLSDKQILKRMAYRDTVSTFDYLKNRKAFEGETGEVLPHDRYAGAVVRDVAGN